MPTTTARTPLRAYLAALIALLLIGVAYRPLMHAWYQLKNVAPSDQETIKLMRSLNKERQAEGLRLATRMNPVSDEVLTLISDLAFAAADLGVRQQAAQHLIVIAQRQALPTEVLQRLPTVTPDIDRNLVTTYANLVNHAVREHPPPANAVTYLDALIDQGDWRAKNIAIRAFGQIGFYHGLDDARIAGLTAMATHKNERGQQLHSAEVAWALKLVGQKRTLPPTTIEILVEITKKDRDANARQNAISAISTQLASAPALVDTIEAALKDPDSRVRGAARRVLYELETARPADFDEDLQVAADEQAPATRRLRALQRLIRRDPTHDRVRTILELMSRHEDATLRAGVASIAGALPDQAAEAFFARALADTDPQVRAAAVLPLIAKRAAEGEDAQISSVKRLLGDEALDVQRKVLVAIRSNELNTEALRSSLRNTAIDDPQLAREQAMLLDSLERASQTSLQRLWGDLLEPDNYGIFAFIAVAALAIVAFAYHLLYFAARCFVYLSARRWRALTALGVVLTWLGTSFALGWAFFIGAFVAGGHNSAPPLADQLLVVGILLLLVSVYALLGLGLRRLIRV